MTTAAAQASIDGRLFRSTMGRFATGVTVISVVHAGNPHGMTANGFVSVSLDPALVLVSIGTRARMHDMLGVGAVYGVSFLAEQQQQLSAHFAGQRQPGFTPTFTWHDGVPLIDGAVGHLLARVVDAHPAGDHTLFIGQVEYIACGPGWPLLFYSGRYEQVHPQGIHTHTEWSWL